MKKLSIIIPCYNAEKYITMSIESLVNQTIGIKNLELIFVNDASTDKTLNILYEWEKKYPESIFIINCKENGKQGRARNIGITYATSMYIGFMDIDDIIELCMYENLYEIAIVNNSDLVVCKNVRRTHKQILNFPLNKVTGNDRSLNIQTVEDRLDFLEIDINVAVWNKIYKKSVITDNNIYFPEGCIYEDIFFSELVKHYVKKVYILDKILYHHIINLNSCSYSKDIKAKSDFIEVNQMKIKELRLREIYNNYAQYYEREYFIDYITLICNLLKSYTNISSQFFNTVNFSTIELFPFYRCIPIFQALLNGQKGHLYKAICESFTLETIDDEYIQKLFKTYTEVQ